MPRKGNTDLKKITLRLSVDDWAWLSETYGETGATPIVRTLIHKHRLEVMQRVQELSTDLQEELDV